jgi:hypothetical protein
MSEPENPRWLNDVADELRREVPVRAAWRTRLLDDVAHSRRPSVANDFDDRFDDPARSAEIPTRGRRTLTLTPVTGVAAAALFALLGAGAMYGVLGSRTTRSGGDPTSLQAPVVSASNRETVRFELAAPRASHVMLVGSFNEWNPTATPLVRDAATGKWVVSLRLPPGRHVYAFVVDGDVTADPAAPRAADDDFGSANSVVLVSSPRT